MPRAFSDGQMFERSDDVRRHPFGRIRHSCASQALALSRKTVLCQRNRFQGVGEMRIVHCRRRRLARMTLRPAQRTSWPRQTRQDPWSSMAPSLPFSARSMDGLRRSYSISTEARLSTFQPTRRPPLSRTGCCPCLCLTVRRAYEPPPLGGRMSGLCGSIRDSFQPLPRTILPSSSLSQARWSLVGSQWQVANFEYVPKYRRELLSSDDNTVLRFVVDADASFGAGSLPCDSVCRTCGQSLGDELDYSP
jgi:hypothetical protein